LFGINEKNIIINVPVFNRKKVQFSYESIVEKPVKNQGGDRACLLP
jgi:hypothetical protein